MSTWWNINPNYGGSVSGKIGPGYVGDVPISGTIIETLEQDLGAKRMPVLHIDQRMMDSGTLQGFNAVHKAALQNIYSIGRIPFVSWGGWDLGARANNFSLRLSQIAAGVFDSYFTTYFTEAATWAHPFWWRPWPEMNVTDMYVANGDFPWCVGSIVDAGNSWTNTAANYVAAWQKIRGLARAAGATNVSFVWCPTIRMTTGKTSTAGALSQFWPGSANVDWIGVDGFQDGYTVTSGGLSGTPTLATFAQVFRGATAGAVGGPFTDTWGELLALDTTNKLPFCIPRTNCSLAVAPISGSRAIRAAYMQDALENGIPGLARLGLVSWYWNQLGTPSYYAQDLDITSPTNGITAAIFALSSVDFVQFMQSLGSAYYVDAAQFDMPPDLKPLTPLWLCDQWDRYRRDVRSTLGLKAYWRGNEASGTIADDSGLGHTGTVNGAVTYGNAPVVPSNPWDTSLGYPGVVTAYVDAGDSNDYSPLNAAYTLETSFQVAALPGAQGVLISKGSGAGFEFALRLTASGLETIFWDSGGTTYVASAYGLTITLNVPHLVHAVFDPVGDPVHPLKITLDGNVGAKGISGAVDLAHAMSNTTAPLRLGVRGDAVQPLTGLQAHSILILGAITDQTILEHYASWRAVPVISSIVTTPAPTGSTITWTTDVGATSQIEYWPTR